MLPDSKEVGNRLKLLRGDISPQVLADVCGVSRQAYWMYESGERVPSDEVKKKLADYYHKPVDDIFFTLEVNNR